MSLVGRIKYLASCISERVITAMSLLLLGVFIVLYVKGPAPASSNNSGVAVPQYTSFRGGSTNIWKPVTNNDYSWIHSTSQFNEIGALIALAFESTVPEKFLVDVGARGRELSNSYDLLKMFHWKGLLVDAHPQAIEDIKRGFAGLDVEIVHSAVTDYTGTATFTLSHAVDTSSMTTDWTTRFGGSTGTITVPAERLSNIVKKYKVPRRFGLLSVDVEGQDVKVLNDLFMNSDCRPEYIIIETLDGPKFYSLDELDFVPEIKNDYYEMGRTFANLLLKRK